MRTVLLAIGAVIAMSSAASAKTVVCDGEAESLQARIVISQPWLTEKTGKWYCEMWYTSKAWEQERDFCDDDGYCHFRAHVLKRDGNFYTIDRIVGKPHEDEN